MSDSRKLLLVCTSLLLPVSCSNNAFHFYKVHNTLYTDIQLNTSFAQRLTILAPQLSEQEEEIFNAMWASMKTRKDYEIINRKFTDYATQRKVDLPPPLMT